MIKTTLTARAFLAALVPLAGVTDKRSTIPILSNVLLEAEGDTLRMTTTDLDMVAEAVLEVAGVGDWSTTVPVHQLVATLKKAAKDAPIGFAPPLDDPRMGLQVGKALLRFPVMATGDFPVMSPVDPTTVILVNAGEMAGALAEAVKFASKDEYGHHGLALNTVCLDIGDDGLVVRATDGQKLFQRPLREADREGEAGRPLLSRKAATWIGKNAAKLGETWVEISERKLRFSWAGGSYAVKLVDGRFPDALGKAGGPRVGTMKAGELATALELVGVVAAHDKAKHRVRLEGGAGEVRVLLVTDFLDAAGNHHGKAWAETAIDAPGVGDFYLEATGSTLMAALKSFGTCESIGLEMSDAIAPFILRSTLDEDRETTIMPLRPIGDVAHRPPAPVIPDPSNVVELAAFRRAA